MNREKGKYRIKHQELEYKLTFNLGTRPYCLDHYSVIQNFFRSAILTRVDKPEDISHNHDAQEHAKGLIKEKHSLEDYDDLNNVLDAFRRWQDHNDLYPKVLHAHGENSKGEPIEATWQALNRFQTDRNIRPLSEALTHYYGPGVFLTLTIDHSIIPSLKDAWENVSKRWNIFMTRLSKELNVPRKEIHYIWVLEAQGNGYPHIHALFLGIDWLFYAGNKKEWIEDNPHSKNLKHFWKWGSVYVNSTKSGQNVKNPIDYMMKYIRKTFDPYSDDSKKELTQAMLWAFNKRSWNTSRGIFEYLDFHVRTKHVMKLEEMLTFERLIGQKTPYVRLIPAPKPNVEIEECEYYTTSDEDLNYLSEKSAYFEATYEERRALDFLIKARNNGHTDWVYYMRPKMEKPLIPYRKRFKSHDVLDV